MARGSWASGGFCPGCHSLIPKFSRFDGHANLFPPVLNGPPSALTFPINLNRVAAWEVYYRLQTLAIPCHCGVHQPLQVSAETPLALAQIWSVVKTQTAPKADLAAHLNRCWQQRISQ